MTSPIPLLVLRILMVAVAVPVLVGCSRAPVLSAATIEGRDVRESDLPEMTKLIESFRSHLGTWTDGVPRDAIPIEVVHPKYGSVRYLYSPSRKAILWVDDAKDRTRGCSVSGHSALVIERCFKNAE